MCVEMQILVGSLEAHEHVKCMAFPTISSNVLSARMDTTDFTFSSTLNKSLQVFWLDCFDIRVNQKYEKYEEALEIISNYSFIDNSNL